MTDTPSENRELKNTSYELFILLLGILSIFNLVLLFMPGFSPIVTGVVGIIDFFVTIIFMGDFLYRFFTAESKRDYFFKDWGWADFLASLPFQQTRIFRLFRIVKVVRLMRAFGLRKMLYEVRDNRAGSALYVTVFLVIMVLEFGGIAMVYIEAPSPDSNIVTSADAVWWAFVTITTVGYGDLYPVTNTGRLVGMMVMILGVSLFGVLTGFLANAFLAPDEPTAPAASEQENVATGAATQINEFRRLLEEQAQANTLLQQKLDAFEKLMQGDSVSSA